MLLRIFLLLGSFTLSACGASDKDSSVSDTEGDVQYRVTLITHWNSTDFPTEYPSNAHWSPPIGTVHNEQVVFWRVDDQPASEGIEVMAESGGTAPFSNEVEAARDNGYSQGLIKANSIGSGSGSSSIEFSTTDDYPLFSFVSMIAPSPDWFVGVDSLALQEDGQWAERLEVNLPLYDAGTDDGVSFTSANSDTASQSLSITTVTTNRADSDFEQGVHFNSAKYVATLVIERI